MEDDVATCGVCARELHLSADNLVHLQDTIAEAEEGLSSGELALNANELHGRR